MTRHLDQSSMCTASPQQFHADNNALDLCLHVQQANLESLAVAEGNEKMGHAGNDIMLASMMHDDTNLSVTPGHEHEVPGRCLARDCVSTTMNLQSGSELPVRTTLLSMPHAGGGLTAVHRQAPAGTQASQAGSQVEVSFLRCPNL